MVELVAEFAWGWAKGTPVFRAGQEAHAKDVSYVLSLEHHRPALCLWKAPQAHLCRYHHNEEGTKELYRCPASRPPRLAAYILMAMTHLSVI